MTRIYFLLTILYLLPQLFLETIKVKPWTDPVQFLANGTLPDISILTQLGSIRLKQEGPLQVRSPLIYDK